MGGDSVLGLLGLLPRACPPGRNRGLTLLSVHRRDHTHTYTHVHTHRHIDAHIHTHTLTRYEIVKDSFLINVRRGDNEIEAWRIFISQEFIFQIQ